MRAVAPMARRKITLAGRALARALGQVIRKRRHARGLSQEALAELAGFHRTQVGFLERGERIPSVETVVSAANALGTKASELLRAIGF